MKHLIIGNGIAGVQASEVIRKLDPDCEITLIGEENFLPYSRPMIGLLLEGRIPADFMVIRKDDFFRSLRIRHHMAERVEQVVPERREARISTGKTYLFDRLLIATGADPLTIKAEGMDLKNIFFMRNEAHVSRIAQALPKAERALVIGCGLVGLKAAQALRQRGLEVAVVEKMGHPLPLVADPRGADIISKVLNRMGLKILTNTEVRAFEGKGKVERAVLSDGSKISCDLVVMAVGFRPAISFMPAGSVRVRDGILVNRYLETDIKGVYAAGDVAESLDVAWNESRVNPIWPVAAEQGLIAGMNMAGRKVAYPGSLGRNVFRIGDVDLLTGGRVNPSTDGSFTVLTTEDRRRNTYRKLVFQNDILVGLVMVNAIEQGGVLLSLIHRKTPVTIRKEILIDPSFNFSTLLPRTKANASL
jgi:nitrite reductase (NADH) large subunit